MTSPDGATPAKTLTAGDLYEMQSYTREGVAQAANIDLRDAAETARVALLGDLLGGFLNVAANADNAVDVVIAAIVYALKGVTGGVIDLTGWLQDTRDTANTADTNASNAVIAVAGKPDFSDIPRPPAGASLNIGREYSTFPRGNLNYGAASSVSSVAAAADGTTPHVHALNQTPEYKPAGNGANLLEIGYIKATQDDEVTHIGWWTGGSATWAGITALYAGLFRVDPTNGNLSLLNPGTAANDIKSSGSSTNTEYLMPLGVTVDILQDEWYAVGLLQRTSAFQTCASLLCTTLTNMNRTGTQYPRKAYAYAGGYTSMPSSIAEGSLNYGSSTKLPFYVMR